MKRKIICLAMLLSTIAVFGQRQTSIEEINANPALFNHEEVTFKGFVTRYVAGTATTSSYYELQGDYGARIRVNTSLPAPDINSCYIVVGTVTIHNQEPLVIEKNKRACPREGYSLRVQLNPQNAGSVTTSASANVAPGSNVDLVASPDFWFKFSNWTKGNQILGTDERLVFQMPEENVVITANFQRNYLPIILIAAGAILIIVLLIFVFTRPKQQIPPPPVMPDLDQQITAAPSSVQEPAKETIIINKGQSYDTIRYQAKVPPTVKFIPGELEIISGLDKGKSFMMAGYPTADGNVATIGRDHDGWENLIPDDRHYAHIRLKDESNTLSRMQAELIHRGGKLYLKNLSKVNPTQVDGSDVPVNEVVEVMPNSTIKTGFIEFVYKTK